MDDGGSTPVWPGWTAAGLLAAVLLWLGKVHLPAKDRQIDRMIDLLLAESERNRAAYQELIARIDELLKK